MWIILMLISLLSGKGLSGSVSRFTNVQCEILDPAFLSYKQCNLKLLGRGIVALNIHATIVKGSHSNAKVNLSLWRRFSGFRPFMFNHTFDYCKYMDIDNNKLSFIKIVIDALAENTNLNHSCPYEGDLIARNMVFQQEYLRYLPVPSGEYMLQIKVAKNNDWKTNIKIYILHNEDLIDS